MSEEEIIKYIKSEIDRDRHLKGFEEEINALEGILKLYENEKKITTSLMEANDRLNKKINERTKGDKLVEERDKEKAKNEELKKGIKSLMESRKKWRYRYNREKAKNKELKKKLANRVELLEE